MPVLQRLRAVLVLFALATALLLVSPGAVLADCMAPPALEEAVKTADLVFVGTVTDAINGNRWATVSVEEIWRGPDLPATLLLKGGADPNSASSVDRSFEVGQRYIFFPYVDVGDEPILGIPAGGLADNSCSSTQPWSDDMAALRPADARTGSVETPNEGMSVDLGLIAGIGGVVLLVVAAMLGVGLLARGRSD